MAEGVIVFVEYDLTPLLCWLCGRSKEVWGRSPPPIAPVYFRHRVVGTVKSLWTWGSKLGAASSVNWWYQCAVRTVDRGDECVDDVG